MLLTFKRQKKSMRLSEHNFALNGKIIGLTISPLSLRTGESIFSSDGDGDEGSSGSESTSDRLSVSDSGWRPRYSHMKTRMMRFHRRIVSRSSADASSYNQPKSSIFPPKSKARRGRGMDVPPVYAKPSETDSQSHATHLLPFSKTVYDHPQ